MNQPEIDSKFLKMAEELLPCLCHLDYTGGYHYPDCLTKFRPSVALALQEAYEAGVNSCTAIVDRRIQELKEQPR